MEEIDIIELLKRVKEGKAPKLIEIENEKYSFFENYVTLDEIYDSVEQTNFWCINTLELDTKIKILDKPIIEELKVKEGHTDLSGLPYTEYPTKDEIIEKINEIIKHINNN